MFRKIRIIAIGFMYISVTALNAQKAPSSGGEFVFENNDKCLSDDQRLEIKDQISSNVKMLKKQGLIPDQNEKSIVSFNWPVVKDPALTFNNYYGIANFVDQDNSSGIGDYNCGQRSYNGHKGIDISTWPFYWYQYDNDYISIVAGESGIIVNKQDGNADNSCVWDGGGWNAIYVQHEDGSVAWYGHMKLNGLTPKGVGDTVEQGEFLGYMASSGNSTGPHLHFEIYDDENDLVDPYGGECNSLNEATWWTDQQNYREPTINAALTHDMSPEMGCPSENEIPNFSNEFYENETIYFAVYYRDQIANEISTYIVRGPDGIVYDTWEHSSSETYSFSWWNWTGVLNDFVPGGTWTFEVEFLDQIVIHEFEYVNVTALEELNNQSILSVYPNPSSEKLFINGLTDEVWNYSIIDIDGRIVSSGSTPDEYIDIAKLSKGSYFIYISFEDVIIIERFVKM